MDERTVYAVFTNTDLTEGRGQQYVTHYCETEATARRVGSRGYVMGSDCPIQPVQLFKHGSRWYGPVSVVPPTDADKVLQEQIDARRSAIERAKAAGLSDADLALIEKGARNV